VTGDVRAVLCSLTVCQMLCEN